jgi:anti-sigma regulatory factor (Ser/Thr protein kinase)
MALSDSPEAASSTLPVPIVSEHPRIFRRRPRYQWVLVDLGLIGGIGVATGLAVHALATGLGYEERGVLHSILPALIYTAVMLNGQAATAYLAFRFISLRTPWHGVAHVGIQALATLASFVLATVFVSVVYGSGFGTVEGPWSGMFGVIAGVAFLASLVCNTVCYLFIFYRRAVASENAALEAQLGALRAQINPHFLFNSLNSIAALIRSRPREAETVTEDLAELFRYSLRAARTPVVTLQEEIEAAELYLAIERARFGDRLAVRIDVPPRLWSALVPSLVVQPLVENAVKHGLDSTDETLQILVAAAEHRGRVTLSVTDDGPGFPHVPPEAILSRGSGLRNVKERIELHFGGGAGFHLRRDGVELSFPLRARGEDEQGAAIAATTTAAS